VATRDPELRTTDLRETTPEATVRELLGWRPSGGVFSVYLDVDPADRSESWRVRARNGAEEAAGGLPQEAPRETRLGVEATAPRIESLVAAAVHELEPRGVVGFV
jgi:hypothetical protein